MKPAAGPEETDPRFPSGPWHGFWLQKEVPPGKHPTDLNLHFSAGVLTGEGRDWVGEYLMRGRYDLESGRCRWIKTYVGRHDVQYDGYNEGKGIWGTWSMEWDGRRLHGGFHIWPRDMGDPTGRALAEEAETPAELHEKVPVGVSLTVR